MVRLSVYLLIAELEPKQLSAINTIKATIGTINLEPRYFTNIIFARFKLGIAIIMGDDGSSVITLVVIPLPVWNM